MKLTQLFSSGETHTAESTGRSQMTPAQAANLNRQIRALVPGQTISGEVISRNGNEVQIKLSEDMVLNARIDRNLNIEVGKNMSFEVKNNGSSLTLSPLFTNVSTDVNVLKALDMAGLPVNRASVSMTEQLMAAGMSVNRNSLQQIYREINSFLQGDISDIINLHKLGMPVNEANVNQMASYRNLTHQLTEGMDTIMEALPEVFDSMVADGDAFGAVKLYQEILSLIQEGEGQTVSGGEALPGQENLSGEGNAVIQPGAETGQMAESGSLAGENGAVGTGTAGTGVAGIGDVGTGVAGTGDAASGAVASNINAPDAAGTNTVEELTGLLKDGKTLQEGSRGKAPETGQTLQNAGAKDTLPQTGVSDTAAQDTETKVSRELRMAVADETLKLLDNMQLPAQEASVIRGQVMQFAGGQADIQQFFASLSFLADSGKMSSEAMEGLEKLFSGRNFRELMTGQLKKLWTISPRELASPGKVEELYRRMDRQLKSLTQALENAGQTGSTAFKAASSMSQNVDFMQQINQMYAYVQLPLRLREGEAHGELYVYTNKKKLTSKDGTISALLHLDMDNLGPVDVYVAMQNNKVNTKFYLQDDEMIDFMAAHMDLLTERLKKRGYACSFSMVTREESGGEATDGGLGPILGQEKGIALSQYAFDVRT